MILRNGVKIQQLENKAFLQKNKFNLNLRLTYHEYIAERLENTLKSVFKPLVKAGFSISIFVNANRSEAKITSTTCLKSVLDTLKFAYVVEKRFNTSKGVKYVYNIGYNTYI